MNDTVIRVENLGKRYRIGVAEKQSQSLRKNLVSLAGAPFRYLRRSLREPEPDEIIWALRNVSFEVKRGDVLGVIGRNGAGKTTLLKILSRITEPTEGEAEIRGRVRSLLEVGTGFHPELTGRENIYLNGAIMGMKKAEIACKFDEIVAFSGVEKFIDTPVKRYSSGMYVRLAFAVAACLTPEILLVDEVLAVGDVAFQKKCLGKMEDVAKGGRTVLFVSHNIGAIETLCPKAILLEKGQILLAGSSRDVVSSYLRLNSEVVDDPFKNCVRSGNGLVRVVSIHLESVQGKYMVAAISGEPALFVFDYITHDLDGSQSISLGFSISTDREFNLFSYYSHDSGVTFQQLPQRGSIKCLIPKLSLSPGTYLVGCRVLVGGEEADWPRVRVPFMVKAGDFYNTGTVATSAWGPILISGKWSLQTIVGEDK